VATSQTNKFHWSSERVTEDAGGPSLRWAVKSLLEELVTSSPLARCVARLAASGTQMPADRRGNACQTIARAAAEPAWPANGEPPASIVARPAEPPDYQPEGESRSRTAASPEAPAAGTGGNGRLRIRVEPDDASVYLDGRFVGTGADLASNEDGLVLAPGRHQVAVIRPGHRAEERIFDAVAGRNVELTVTLSRSGPGG
jgi:hypothetical protein